MKRRRFITLLLTPLALAMLCGAASGQTPATPTPAGSPTPAPTAAASPTGTPQAGGGVASNIYYLWPIVAGVAGGLSSALLTIVALIKSKDYFISYLSEDRSIQLIKKQGGFWGVGEAEPFERTLKDMLEKDSIVKAIRLHGGFITEERLKEEVRKYKKLREEYATTLKEHAGNILLLVSQVKAIENTVNEDKLKRSLEEQARRMIREYKHPQEGEIEGS